MTLHKLSTTDLQFVVTRIPKDVRDEMRLAITAEI